MAENKKYKEEYVQDKCFRGLKFVEAPDGISKRERKKIIRENIRRAMESLNPEQREAVESIVAYARAGGKRRCKL